MTGRYIIRGLMMTAFGALSLTVLLQGAIDPPPVAEAALRKDAAAVRALIKQGAEVNAPHGDGMTALHWAASHGDADLVQTLLTAGANVKAQARINAYTPLFLASQHGHADVVDRLLKAHANPNAVSSTGSTPLMLAAASGHVDAVKLLLAAGANVNAKETGRGQTALMYAAAYNRAPAIKMLTELGADPNATASVRDLFKEQEGFGRGDGSNRRGLIPGVDRNYSYSELVGYEGGLAPLHLAARQGHADAVAALLAAGANVNQVSAGDKTSPLLIATINGHFDLAKSLLDHGADPNLSAENGVRPIFAAVACQWAVVAVYPQPKAHLQQKLSYLDVMKAMLDRGADPNVRLKKKVWYSEYNHDDSNMDETGATPLWRAAYAGDVDAIRLLVSYGADPNLATMTLPAGRRYGYLTQGDGTDHTGLAPVPAGAPSVTPLLSAAGVGHGRGAGSTTHHSLKGWLPAVQYLVDELGADVNWRDAGGDTALHYAAARGDNEMIGYLISKGANAKVVNRAGQTIADMANGPTERGVRPFPDTLALLATMGITPNYKCTLCS
jgi:ankyrin repeat protein